MEFSGSGPSQQRPASSRRGGGDRERPPLTGGALEEKLTSLLRATSELASREAAARSAEHQASVVASIETLNPLIVADAVARVKARIEEEKGEAAACKITVAAMASAPVGSFQER